MFFISCTAHAIKSEIDRTTITNQKLTKAGLKYVPVQRYMANLEASIKKDTQWVVFEYNDEVLWARVQKSVADLLYKEWRAGRLMGAQAEHAFFVTCNRTTMTQSDINNGRLICQIGVAPTKPAEFTLFQLRHNTATTPVE